MEDKRKMKNYKIAVAGTGYVGLQVAHDLFILGTIASKLFVIVVFAIFKWFNVVHPRICMRNR